MSIFSKFFFTIFGSSILAWLRDFVSRVTGDGGTLSDQGHTKDVYTDTYPYGPTLIQTCDSGGSTAQNFAVGSEDISNATYWFVASVTATSSAEPNPFGGSGVTLVAETGSTTAKGFYQQSAYQASIVSGQAYTVSAYVKKGDGSLAPDVIQVTYLSGGFGTDFYANYNINTGVVTKVSGGFADIEDVGGGWYRISLAGVATATGALGTFVFAFANNDPNANRFPSYTGNVNRDVYIWGVQFVQGNEAGEYIKTTTAAIDSIGTLYSAVANPQALLETFTGSAAAYSLRSLSASTTNVVKVRRSSDDTEQDFTAAEITDGTLLTFVNEDVDIYTSDFTSGNEDIREVNGTGSDGETVAGVSDAYKFTLSRGASRHYAQKFSLFNNNTYNVNFDYYIPSGQTVDGIRITTDSGLDPFFQESVTGSWTSVTITDWVVSVGGLLRFEASDGGSYLGLDADGDVFYLKNIVVTQTTADGFVTTWYDQSGNGYNATQATAASQPKIVSSGSLVTENGKAAIDFDNVSLEYLSSTITSPSNNVCFVGVCYTTSLSGNRGFMEIFDGANDGYELRYDGTTSEANFAINSTDLLVTSTNQFLWFANYDGSTQLNSINGSGDTQSAVESISVSSNTLKIGARLPASGASNYYWDGKIQEAIFYPSDQSANRTGIEGNINDYYNIYS